MLSYLTQKVPWVRPKDTGRSTNCLINDVGIYIHKKERGYHNYALPYSWDVRLGHKTREGALDELNDTIDVSHVEKTLAEIGYDEARYHSGVDQTALEADGGNWVLWNRNLVFPRVLRTNGPWVIELMDLETSKVRKIADLGPEANYGAGFSVSPDGRTIVFVKHLCKAST